MSEFGAGLAGRGRRAERGHPPREPGAARDGQGAGHPRRAEPRAGRAGARLRPRARPARARARARSRTGSCRRTTTGEASAERRDGHPPRHQPPAGLPARAAAADGRPRQGGRPGHAAAPRPRRRGAADGPPDQGTRDVLRRRPTRASRASATRSSAAGPALIQRAAADPGARRGSAAGRARGRGPGQADGEPRTRPAASSASTTSSTTARSSPTASTRSATTCARASWPPPRAPTYAIAPAGACWTHVLDPEQERRGAVRHRRSARRQGREDARQRRAPGRQPAGGAPRHPRDEGRDAGARPGLERIRAARGAAGSAALGRPTSRCSTTCSGASG